MIRWRGVLAGIVLVSLLMVGGCASGTDTSTPATEPAAEAPDLAGTSWTCYQFGVSGEPQPVPADVSITAEFSADGKLTGSSGVNSYSTTYETDGTSIKISDAIVSTKMAGPEEAMRLETDYLTTLPTAATFNLKTDELILFGPASNTIARYRPAQ